MTIDQALKHPWITEYQALPDRPLSGVVFNRLKRFTEMTKLHGIMLNVVAKYLPDDSIGQLRDMFKTLVRWWYPPSHGCWCQACAQARDGFHVVQWCCVDTMLRACCMHADSCVLVHMHRVICCHILCCQVICCQVIDSPMLCCQIPIDHYALALTIMLCC